LPRAGALSVLELLFGLGVGFLLGALSVVPVVAGLERQLEKTRQAAREVFEAAFLKRVSEPPATPPEGKEA
jgi:hypothetical protein